MTNKPSTPLIPSVSFFVETGSCVYRLGSNFRLDSCIFERKYRHPLCPSVFLLLLCYILFVYVPQYPESPSVTAFWCHPPPTGETPPLSTQLSVSYLFATCFPEGLLVVHVLGSQVSLLPSIESYRLHSDTPLAYSPTFDPSTVST